MPHHFKVWNDTSMEVWVDNNSISTVYTFECLGTRLIFVTSFRAFYKGFIVLAITSNMANPLALTTTQWIRNILSNKNVQLKKN